MDMVMISAIKQFFGWALILMLSMEQSKAQDFTIKMWISIK